jgi:SAM-dependent methyltransferase
LLKVFLEVLRLYTAFASVYDRLMADVDYPDWAAYYRALLTHRGLPGGKVCECACGTGNLTIPLGASGYLMTGADLSEEMLFEAGRKARKAGAAIPFIRQDMRALLLHRPMDGVLCTCDGVNYLPSAQDVLAFFGAAWRALQPGGPLVFDVSTPYKLRHVLGNHFIGDEKADIAYLWKNAYCPNPESVRMDLSVFVRSEGETYRRVSERQTQYAYDADMLRSLLSQAGFEGIEIFGDRTFAPPSPDEQRWHIAAQKPEQPDY